MAPYYSYNKVICFPKKTTLFFNNDSKFQLQSKNPIRFGHNRRGSITNIDYRMIRSLGQRFRENLGVSLSFVYIFQQVNYPPGKKVRSLSARGPFDSLFPWELERSLTARSPFDSLIFYQGHTLHPEDFFFIMVVGGVQLFGSLNLLIQIWYIVQVLMYLQSINIKNLCKTKVLWIFNFGEVETRVLKDLDINIHNIFVFGQKLVPLNKGYLKQKITDIAKREKQKKRRPG